MLQLLFNDVFVCFDKGHEEIEMFNGKTVTIVGCYHVNKHTCTTGIVMGVPKGLNFSDNPDESVSYDTDMELHIGDRVIFDYLTVEHATKNYKPSIIDGKECYPVKYDMISVAIRGKKVIPINGVILVEPLEIGELSDKVATPEFMAKDRSSTSGKIKYMGLPVRRYLLDDYRNTDMAINEGIYDVKVGDTVFFNWSDSVPLQFHLHQVVDNGTPLYQMRRKDLIAKEA